MNGSKQQNSTRARGKEKGSWSEAVINHILEDVNVGVPFGLMAAWVGFVQEPKNHPRGSGWTGGTKRYQERGGHKNV